MKSSLIRSTWKKLAGAAIVLAVWNVAAASIAQIYRPGNACPQVESIQRQLGIPADGVYGSETESAVYRFQARNNIFQDGLAGPETLRALGLENLITNSPASCTAASSYNPGGSSSGRSAPYVVVVPGSDRSLLSRIQVSRPSARPARSRIGAYINAGSFPLRRDAEAVSRDLRRRGFDARVAYRP